VWEEGPNRILKICDTDIHANSVLLIEDSQFNFHPSQELNAPRLTYIPLIEPSFNEELHQLKLEKLNKLAA